MNKIYKPSYHELEQQIAELWQDAIECKETEERIRHLNTVLASNRDVNRLITKEKNRNRLIQGICDSLIKYRGYHSVWIVLIDADHKVFASAESGLEGDFNEIITKINRGELFYCCKNVLHQNNLMTITDPAEACLDCPLSYLYENRGALAARLAYGDKVYGLLTVSVPVAFSRDDEEQLLFRSVADDIAFALHHIEVQEERRTADRKLQQAHADLELRVKERTRTLERLSSKLINAQEEERKRIAGDLHDGIGQTLSAVKFMVETVLEQLRGKVPETELGALETLIPMLQTATEEVRTIVMNLRPSILDDLGILATIGWFCRNFESIYSDIRIEKQIRIRENEVPDDLKTVIFRVMQEALNNVAKHSKANHVTISLGKKEDSVELLIRDNGRGFDVPLARSADFSEKGAGLANMKERTELSDGVFETKSVSGNGMTIRAAWPYKCDLPLTVRPSDN